MTTELHGFGVIDIIMILGITPAAENERWRPRCIRLYML